MRVLCVLGTRPEAIKLAPVVRELRQRAAAGADVVARVCATAQHREMLDQVLQLFEIAVDHDLDVMAKDQTPTEVAAAVLQRLPSILQAERPDWVVVQGDTTTVAATALAAYYARARVAHVEAGLRTRDKWRPFPEEINRRVAGVIADLHFAPTAWAQDNLLREGVPASQVLVTGNTVIDALRWAKARPREGPDPWSAAPDGRRVVLVTAHRRENFGAPLAGICAALREVATRYPEDVHLVYPVHPNPNVQGPVSTLLAGLPNVSLLPPLDYHGLVHLLDRAHLVLTDSGGIQEEAPGLGKPVLVLRDVTERPEGVEAGTAKVVGTDRERIVAETVRLLEDPEEYARMARAVNPYGDGQAAVRIVDALLGRR